jgi:hypothetical protein
MEIYERQTHLIHSLNNLNRHALARLQTVTIKAIIAILCLLPLVGFTWAFADILQILSTWGWTSTTGKVIQVASTQHYRCVQQLSFEECGGWMQVEYVTRVRFEYSINSTYNLASQSFPSPGFMHHYEIGAPITIYYDPNSQDHAIIERYINPLDYIALFFSTVGFLIVNMEMQAWRKRRKSHFMRRIVRVRRHLKRKHSRHFA